MFTKPTIAALCVAFCFLFCISCKKEKVVPSQFKTSVSADNTKNAAGHFIGEHYGGGVVFYIAGSHGLIADENDLGMFTWRPGNYIVPIVGGTKTGLGTGKSNTRKIIKSQTTTHGMYAALACARSTRNGYNDWYLPSIEELGEMCAQKDLIGAFPANHYYSSSQTASQETDIFYQYFPDCSQDAIPNYNVLGVRAVRSF